MLRHALLLISQGILDIASTHVHDDEGHDDEVDEVDVVEVVDVEGVGAL